MKRQKIDLHIHTLYSDGMSEPADIVECAAEQDYDLIAITDHDGIGGISEAQEAGRRLGLRVISGIELATENRDGIGFHILGYDFDTSDEDMLAAIEELKQYREERNIALVKAMNELGCEITMEELRERQPHGYIGKPVIARLLAEKGYIADHHDAYIPGQFLESPEARSVKRRKISTEDSIKLIRNAGGIAVMAHPIQTKGIGTPGTEDFYRNISSIIAELKAQGLDGLECYHPDQNAGQTRRFISIARGYGLKITRGSDFHGPDYMDADKTADPEETGDPQLIQFGE